MFPDSIIVLYTRMNHLEIEKSGVSGRDEG